MLAFLLLALFFVSGVAGLLYETLWTRYLSLFVGHGAYAQLLVLSIFLGGLAVGAAAVARWSRRTPNPLTWYGRAECVLGLYGLAFPAIFQGTLWFAYHVLFPHAGALTGLARWVVAALLILPQCVLLGTTFPLIVSALLRYEPWSRSQGVSRLYACNSLAAALGALVGGFVLVPAVGLPGAIRAAGALSLGVGLVALLAGWNYQWTLERADNDATAAGLSSFRWQSPLARLLLAVSAATAVGSLCYEVAWVRLLTLVLGGATHAFDVMLAAFVLGLGLGAWVIRRRLPTNADALRWLIRVQVVMGLLALATIPLYVQSFGWMAALLGATAKSDGGYALFNVGRLAIALGIMLPATICAGMTLPLLTSAVLHDGAPEESVGLVYATNTAGAIVATLLAGLVLIPLIGVRGVLVSGAAFDLAAGIAVYVYLRWDRIAKDPAYSKRWTRPIVLAAAAVLSLALAAWYPLPRTLLISGIYRAERMPDVSTLQIGFYEDGRTASVASGINTAGRVAFLTTNGKPDASIPLAWFESSVGPDSLRAPLDQDWASQALLPLITLAHRPAAAQVAVIGFGSGMSSHLLLGSSHVASVTTVEIEPAMVRGARVFSGMTQRVYDDPRSHIVIDDAKSYFASRPQQYDLVLSEPSNPWVSGVSNLFTVEFYEEVKRVLAPHAVLGQWMHLYEMNDGLVLSVLAAVHQSFPSYAVYLTHQGDLLIVASMDSVMPRPNWAAAFGGDLTRYDLRHARGLHADDLAALLLGTNVSFGPLLASWPEINSDYRPVLDNGAERARYLHSEAAGFTRLMQERFDVAAALEGRVRDGSAHTAVTVAHVPRLELLAQSAALRSALHTGRIPWSAEPVPPTFAGMVDDAASSLQRCQLAAPPRNWALWASEVLRVEGVLSTGTAGAMLQESAALVQCAEASALRLHAPPDIVAAFQFVRGIDMYDWPTVDRSLRPLLQAAGASVIPPDLLLDGGVVALLKLGRARDARAFFDALAPHGTRDRGDVRLLLLDAQIGVAERLRTPGQGWDRTR